MSDRTYKYTPVPGEDMFEMVHVGIVDQDDVWSKIQLEDGTTLKVKIIVTKVGRSVDRPIPESGGEPLYQVMSRTVVVADVPDELYIEEGEL